MDTSAVFLEDFVFKYLHPSTPLGAAVILLVTIWALFWKSFGLWKASRNNERIWFVAILILSTLGILEIAYLFFIARERLTIEKIKSNIKSYKIQNPFAKKSGE